MSTQTLHPALPVDELIDLLRAGVREVTGIVTIADVRLIQACATAANLNVTWRLPVHGHAAELVEVPPC